MANFSPIMNGAPWAWFAINHLKGGAVPPVNDIMSYDNDDLMAYSNGDIMIYSPN